MQNNNEDYILSNNDPSANDTIDNPFLALLASLSPEQFTLLAAIIGILFANNLNLAEQNLLGLFLTNIGLSLDTISSRSRGSDFIISSNGSNVSLQIALLKKQLSDLEQKLSRQD